jgi:acyl dehydratase
MVKAMDLTSLVGQRFADGQWSFDRERMQALHHAIGITPDSHEIPPTLAFSADMDLRVVDQLFTLTGLAPHQLLHGEQHFSYHRPLLPGQLYQSRAELSATDDKGRFSLLHKHTQLSAEDGALACEMLSIYVAIPTPGVPSSGPLLDTAEAPARVTEPISRGQIAAFARASGDDNRVHLQAEVARLAGHADVFAQGMLGMGMLGALLPSSRLKRFGVRFLSPIALGDRPRLYHQGGATDELLLTNHEGHIRLRGYAELT